MWHYALKAGSTLLTMGANRKMFQGEIDAGRQDMTNALLAGFFREKGISEDRDRANANIRANAGHSGVALSSGSTVATLMESAAQAERDLFLSRKRTEAGVAEARARMQGGARGVANTGWEAALSLAGTGYKAMPDIKAAYDKRFPAAPPEGQ